MEPSATLLAGLVESLISAAVEAQPPVVLLGPARLSRVSHTLKLRVDWMQLVSMPSFNKNNVEANVHRNIVYEFSAH